MNKRWTHKLIELGGLDFHVLLTLIFRSWSIIAGGAMVLLIPVWFTRIEQGYYYTFASLIALQVFFELGMNQVVVQLVSHETAYITRGNNGELTGEEPHVSRLISLLHLLRKWYFVAGICFFLAVSAAGIFFFKNQHELPMSEWLGVWLLLVAAASVNLFLSPSLAIMEGFGDVGEVARVRLAQSVIGYILMWTALSFGIGMWAVPIVPIVGAACTGYWLKTQAHTLNWLQTRDTVKEYSHRVHWRSEVLPFQWRIAVSWISGYLISQLFTPLVFSHQGATEAGRLGIALAIFNALVTVGMSWINAKLPQFTRLIAQGERTQLNRLFIAVVLRSSGFTLLASTIVVIVVYTLHTVGVESIQRIALPSVLICLAIATLTNSFVFAAAAYMRAHREEPMLPVSLISAAITVPAVYFGSMQSVFLTILLYSIVMVGITLPWTTILFLSYFRRTS